MAHEKKDEASYESNRGFRIWESLLQEMGEIRPGVAAQHWTHELTPWRKSVKHLHHPERELSGVPACGLTY